VVSLRRYLQRKRMHRLLPNAPVGTAAPNFFLLSGGNYIWIGKNFWAWDGLRLEAITEYKGSRFTPRIEIGDRVRAGPHLHVGAIGLVQIGHGTNIGSFVTIIDHSHGDPEVATGKPPADDPLTSKGNISIGQRCWIGDKATVLGGVTIGDDSIVGANSVVTKSFPPHSVIGGIPAQLIRTRA